MSEITPERKDYLERIAQENPEGQPVQDQIEIVRARMELEVLHNREIYGK